MASSLLFSLFLSFLVHRTGGQHYLLPDIPDISAVVGELDWPGQWKPETEIVSYLGTVEVQRSWYTYDFSTFFCCLSKLFFNFV